VRQRIELSLGHFAHFERLVELQAGTDAVGCVVAYAHKLGQCIAHWSVLGQELAEDVRHLQTVDSRPLRAMCGFAAILAATVFELRTATVPGFFSVVSPTTARVRLDCEVDQAVIFVFRQQAT
jgi:hypothetical protein